MTSAQPAQTSDNGLVCFTNCLLVQEDSTLAKKDLWIDERDGKIVSAQVRSAILSLNKRRAHKKYSGSFTRSCNDLLVQLTLEDLF